MSFETSQEQPVSQKIVLVEYDRPVNSGLLTNYEAGIWYTKLTPGVVTITGSDGEIGYYTNTNIVDYQHIKSLKISENDLTLVSSLAELRTLENSFYYDKDTTFLYIHFDDWDYPLDKVILPGAVTGFCTQYSQSAYYDNIYYEPRITNVPSLSKSRDPYFYGFLKYNSATISMINNDGFFDNFRELGLYKQAARVLFGFEGLDYADFRQVYSGYIESYSRDYSKFSLEIQDNRKGLSRKIPVNTFDERYYPYISSANKNKVKPIAWGPVRNAKCVCVNQEESGAVDYVFFATDTTYAPLTSIDAVYLDGTELGSGDFVEDVLAGTITISSATILTQYDKVTCDFTAPTSNAVDVLKDIMANFAEIPYTSTFYDTTEVAVAQALAYDIGLYLSQEAKISDVIGQLAESSDFVFFIKDDGKYTIRVYDEDRTPVKQIYQYDWIGEPSIKTDESTFLSSIRIDYNKDQKNNVYTSYLNKDYETAALRRYKAYQQREIQTLIIDESDASAKSVKLLDIGSNVTDIVTRKVKTNHINLELMDFIVASPHTRIDEDEELGVYEIIGINKDLNNNDISLEMRYVKSYTPIITTYLQGYAYLEYAYSEMAFSETTWGTA